MEGNQQFLQDIREAIAEVSPDPWLHVDRTDIFLGTNPLTNRPAIVLRIRTDQADLSAPRLRKHLEGWLGVRVKTIKFSAKASPSEKAASLIAAAAAALLTRELRIGTDHGARSLLNGSAECWVELLLGAPAGPALKIAMVAAAAVKVAETPKNCPVERILGTFRELCAQSRPNKMSSYLIAAARANDIPYASLARSKVIWQFGWGSRGRAFLGAACNDDGYVAFNIAKFKSTAKCLFRELGIPTPRWSELPPGGDAAAALARVGFPCVVKPVDSSWGEGVTANIQTVAEFQAAVALARRKENRRVLVEAYVPGDDHRLMVVDGRLVAAVRRDPPAVVGDGVSSVRQLIDRMNSARRGTPEESGFLTPVDVDSGLLLRLQSHGLTLDTILPARRGYVLRTAANRTGGGSAADVTARVHWQVRAWAEQLAATVGLRVAGIDYITPDIAADPEQVGGGFIEINATPGLQVLAAAGLDHIAISKVVLGRLPGRIPVDIVVAEQTRIEEIVLKVPRQDGHAIAWPGGMEIDGSLMDSRERTPFEIATAVLRNRHVDSATFVWSPEAMTTYGLPVDRVRRTTMVGVTPEDRWGSMLKRISQEIVVGDKLSSKAAPAKACA